MKRFVNSLFAVVLLVLLSCERDPVTPSTETPVALPVSFSNDGSGSVSSGVWSVVDSLRIDSAIVVFKRIKFESHLDSMDVDSLEHDDEDEDDINIKFKGPFVVHVRDVISIDLGRQTLPAATYTGIKFKIHRLKAGEPHEDSDERKWGHRISPDSLPVGASIVVWGFVRKNDEWVPFEFRFDEELEFKVRGAFVIPNTTNTVNIAMNFNPQLWFKNLETGGILDPTELSDSNRSLFRRALHNAFGKGKCGKDDDRDGHPDDD